MKPRFRAEWVRGERGVVDFGKLFTETNEQKFTSHSMYTKQAILETFYPGKLLRISAEKKLNLTQEKQITQKQNGVTVILKRKYSTSSVLQTVVHSKRADIRTV